MLKAKDWDELGLKVSKKAKKQSREHELFALKYSDNINKDLLDEIRETEKKYRSYLDDEIEKYKTKLRANNEQ